MNHIPSPDNSDSGIERAIQAAGKTAPRITPAALQANIGSVHFCTGFQAVADTGEHSVWAPNHIVPRSIEALGCLTICIIVLKNGFVVTGESACASPENFDAQIGRTIARQNAEQKIWPLMGYQLKEQLFQAEQPLEVPA